MSKATERKSVIVFIFVTLVFTVSRVMLFNGFNGTDDLHYAMLAAKMVKGEYDPFQPNDIFSGRIILVAWQALIYKIGGITVFTTSVGTIIAVISSCIITVFGILPGRNAITTLLSSCLFYFNPPLTKDITGISPDPYVLLVSACMLLLLKNTLKEDQSIKSAATNSVLIGSLIATGLLIKESIFIFLPFTILILLLYQRKNEILNSLWMLMSFMVIIALMACGYYYFTGDVFFKISQLKNSSYPNSCNFAFLPFNDLFIRLTYGIWQAFIILGFYPFILGAMISLVKLIQRKAFDWHKEFDVTCFLLLLILSIYFPFSLEGYQPLCAAPRHFLFLAPIAATVIATCMYNEAEVKKSRQLLTFLSLLVLTICMLSTQNKWQWMIYSMIFAYFLLQYVLKRFLGRFHFIIFSLILFASIFENLFLNNTRWFKSMQELRKNVHADYYYFPDHDNMMHWKLLNHFDEGTIHCYNIRKHPFKPFKVYYQNPDSTNFHRGWFIVNKAYTTCSSSLLNKVDSLHKTGYFSNYVIRDSIGAFLIDNKEKLAYIQSIISSEK